VPRPGNLAGADGRSFFWGFAAAYEATFAKAKTQLSPLRSGLIQFHQFRVGVVDARGS